ncbi:hypothetical protein EJ02DRAFT_8043 [Clathrospora elynae]|uniref:Uncharacterized protein n=1 Tax=Clathrospora elynae TaxID=706981 RepID=A0A6A5TAX2_9PLEO|nr:hypothetical protein EJ02DRAFT_8043 [Clathrospora elynae]
MSMPSDDSFGRFPSIFSEITRLTNLSESAQAAANDQFRKFPPPSYRSLLSNKVFFVRKRNILSATILYGLLDVCNMRNVRCLGYGAQVPSIYRALVPIVNTSRISPCSIPGPIDTSSAESKIGIFIGVGVGLFLLFAIGAFCVFRRQSKKRAKALLPPFSQQPDAHQKNASHPLLKEDEDVAALGHKAELESQSQARSQHELGAHPWSTMFQGGREGPQELPVHAGQLPPQELYAEVQIGRGIRR